MKDVELQTLADTAASSHLENARYFADLGAGDWIAVEEDGRVTFPAGEPTYAVVMAVPLTKACTKSVKALRSALRDSAKAGV